MTSYSISVRLQRTTIEEAYVSVPVTDAVMQENPTEDGTNRPDPEKVFATAVELGRTEATWLREDQQIGIHPVQGPPPGAG